MYIIDVEASGLDPESYPIQIGWQHRADLGKFGEILISPHADWVFWSKDAELIHNIPRERLSDGMEISEACHLLNNAFGSSTVYSDAVQADGFWLGRLFSAANIESSFTVGSVFDLVKNEKLSEFRKRLYRQSRPHTALADARAINDVVNYFIPY